ncbi:MAG: hypothetical protein FJ279_06155 [Planctomycetes bacterium]|nr:hypothetical protein [Planctomycetota bacterium]
MKTNGRIRELLATRCYNESHFDDRVVRPLLEYLGIPSEARIPQFPIENPFGGGLLRLDHLVHRADLPLVTVEVKHTRRQFDMGLRQAKNYSRNFKPRQQGCPMLERTVPFFLTVAGDRAEMCRAVVRGLNIEYEPIRHGGKPAFLEWHELLAEAERMLPGAAIAAAQQVVVADVARQFFSDLYEPLENASPLRGKDDRKIILFNTVIDLARRGEPNRIQNACRSAGLGQRAIGKLLNTIAAYRQKIEGNEFVGPAVARGYRSFLLQPGGRGGHCYFTGESQSRPYRDGRRVRYRNVARYFTPTEVTQQMVRMARPRASERVLDMTCGSGSFLAECVDYVARQEGHDRAQSFLTRRLVGIDDDPFCVSCSRALLTFLYPQHADDLRVFLHNGLYERAPIRSEIDEDPQAEPHLRAGRYDLVIGNPPGNDEYSGSNREEIARQRTERFGHAEGGLMDHHCFIRRAVELARPDGGRVCLLVPEGLLARDNRGKPALRNALVEDCQLRAVISLPRVFRNNNARMAIVYLVRGARPRAGRKVLLAEIREHWTDADGREQTTDVFGELEGIVDRLVGK